MYRGDYAPASTVVFNFNTASFADGSPITLAGTPALSVYKNSTTESTTGITLTVDYDSRTGMHHVVIDTSADGTFYAAGNDFDVVITAGTVGGTSVVGRVVAAFSLNNRSPLRPTTAGRTFAVDSSGNAPVSVGTGTGQINVSSGKVPATLANTDVTGNVAADLQTIKTQTVTCAGGVTVPAATLASTTNITAGTITTTTNLTTLPAIPANWLTATGIAAAALNGKGDWLLSSSYTAPPATSAIAAAVWQDTTAGDFTVASSIGKSLYTTGNAPGAANGLALVGSNMGTASSIVSVTNIVSGGAITTSGGKVSGVILTDTATTLTNLPAITAGWLTATGIAASALNGKGDWLLASSYAAPLSAAATATAVWTDTTASDFTTVSSIGKSLYTSGNVPGAASGLALVGSNVGIATSVSGSVGSVTGNVGGNVVGSVGSISGVSFPSGFSSLTPAAIATGVWQDAVTVDFSVTSSIGKSLYTSGNVPGAANGLALVGSNMGTVTSVSGSVGSISGITFPIRFSSLAIDVSGDVTFNNTAIDTVTNLTNLPSIPSNWITAAGIAAGALTAAVWDGTISGHTTGGTFGGALNAAGSAGDPWATVLPGAYLTGTAGHIIGANLDSSVSSRLAAGSYTAPDNAGISGIKTQTDKLLFDGSSFVKSDPQTAVIVGTNNDKTGYSLAQSFPTNFSSLAITSGGAVTVGTNNDKTGYSLAQAFPTNFSSLSISGGGAVLVGTNNDKTGYSLSSSGLDSIVVESGLNPRQALSIIISSIAGVLAGADTNTITIAAAGNETVNRITATVDANGNRSAVVLNPPS